MHYVQIQSIPGKPIKRKGLDVLAWYPAVTPLSTGGLPCPTIVVGAFEKIIKILHRWVGFFPAV